MPGPLEGIRVVECAKFHAGPGGAAILGDMGAEVIKVEDKSGDPERGWLKIGDFPLNTSDGQSIAFEISNRNKQGIVLDLCQDKGREVLYRLVEKADVFLTNFRKPAIAKLKLTYQELYEINPQIIYAVVSGSGREGPDSDLPTFDAQGQGRSGMMISQGGEDNPLLLRIGMIDQMTAIAASHQIITALLVRERCGFGQEVDVSLLSAGMWLLYLNLVIASVQGKEVPRHIRDDSSPLRNYFRCADGNWMIGSHNPPDQYWVPFCKASGLDELAEDPRFDTEDKRWRHATELMAIFDERFATKTRDEWLDVFRESGLVFAPMNSCLDVFNDPQVLANGYMEDFDHPTWGKMRLPAFPIHFSRTPAGTRFSAPQLGEHTDMVLSEIGGYSRQEIKMLRKEGAIQ